MNPSDNETLDQLTQWIGQLLSLWTCAKLIPSCNSNSNSLKGMEKVPSGNVEPLNSDDDVSVSDSVVLETTLSMIRATSLGRIGTLTSRISDFLQAGK